MDLNTLLVTGLRKSAIETFISEHKGDAEVVGALVSHVISSPRPTNRKAIWVLRQWSAINAADLESELDTLITHLSAERDSSILRDLLSVCISCDLNDDQLGRVTDRAFAFLSVGNYDVAVMFNSMRFLEQTCMRWPELIPEFRETLKKQRELHTNTFCRQADKLLLKYSKLR